MRSNSNLKIPDEAIILAAGRGTRMKFNRPKAMVEICGSTLLRLVDEQLQGINNKVLVISEEIKKEFSNKLALEGKNVKYALQTERRGTGHAVSIAMQYIEESSRVVVIAYVDVPFIKKETIQKAASIVESGEKDIIVIGFNHSRDNSYGKIITHGQTNEDGNFASVLKIKENSRETELCNSGVIILHRSVLKECVPLIKRNQERQEYFLTDIVEIAVSKKFKAGCIVVPKEEALGVNSPQELSNATKIYQDILIEKQIENGAEIPSREGVLLWHDTVIGSGTKLSPGVQFGQKVNVGKNCTIAPFSLLENCTIGDGSNVSSHVVIKNETEVGKNTLIREFSLLEGCKVADNCEIGPFARLRENTNLEGNVKIGNFVELKSSSVASGSRIKHLSYIGDAEVGKGVNIGAGSITCNYNGFEKNKTVIKDGAFLGSGTMMIAPIEIGEDSVIGAGTVLRENVNHSELVVDQRKNVHLANGGVKYRYKKQNAPKSNSQEEKGVVLQNNEQVMPKKRQRSQNKKS